MRTTVNNNILIDNQYIDVVDTFNFLGITLDSNLSWKPHTNLIYNKLSRIIGIIARVKNILPTHILKTLYVSLFLPHITYGILCWGYRQERLDGMQKKAIRLITKSKYLAHTSPIFKNNSLLTIQDIHTISQLKLYYKIINKQTPQYFNNNMLKKTRITQHNTRQTNVYATPIIHHEYAKKSFHYSIHILLSIIPPIVLCKCSTHSYDGFSYYIKQWLMDQYRVECVITNCFVCSHN